jgi:hypothetical protein
LLSGGLVLLAAELWVDGRKAAVQPAAAEATAKESAAAEPAAESASPESAAVQPAAEPSDTSASEGEAHE